MNYRHHQRINLNASRIKSITLTKNLSSIVASDSDNKALNSAWMGWDRLWLVVSATMKQYVHAIKKGKDLKAPNDVLAGLGQVLYLSQVKFGLVFSIFGSRNKCVCNVIVMQWRVGTKYNDDANLDGVSNHNGVG